MEEVSRQIDDLENEILDLINDLEYCDDHFKQTRLRVSIDQKRQKLFTLKASFEKIYISA